jgi:ADP-ribose pyrophosphatase YjhB (NUDIX family)
MTAHHHQKSYGLNIGMKEKPSHYHSHTSIPFHANRYNSKHKTKSVTSKTTCDEKQENVSMRKCVCCNCGASGHMYRHCLQPITSYGCIVFRRIRNSTEYLMVQRRDSLAYVEFLRGKYRLDNVTYISRLLKGMTRDELDRLRDLSFSELWNQLWTGASRNFLREQNDADAKLTHLRRGYSINDNHETGDKHQISLNSLIETITDDVCLPETEWGWPKGRRDLMETDRECAVREFWEETGIRPNCIRIINNVNPVSEEFTGSNGIRYKHVYYLAEYVGPSFTKHNRFQTTEIRAVKWMDFNQVMSKLSSSHVCQEKWNLFKTVHSSVMKMAPVNRGVSSTCPKIQHKGM